MKVRRVFSLEESVAATKADASTGVNVLRVMEDLIAALADDFTPFRFIYILREAFDVPVRNLKEILAWDRIGEGSIPTATAVELVRPWLVAAGAT